MANQLVPLTLNTVFLLAFWSFEIVVGRQRFAIEPVDRTVTQGSVALLNCRVVEKGGELQWTRNGFGLGTDRGLHGYDRYTMLGSDALGDYNLLISRAQLEDDADFQCQVTPTDTEPRIISRVAKVIVHLPPNEPVIDNARAVLPVMLNTPTNISCFADGGKPAAEITWYRERVMVSESVYPTTRVQPDGKRFNSTSKVTIIPTKSDSGKQIECRATNVAMNDAFRTTAILDVQYVPEVNMRVNVTRSIKEAQYVRFSCEGVGNPYEITWKWYRNDDVIINQTRNTLLISSIGREYNGNTISCQASNSVGATKKTFLLNVEYGPQFLNAVRHVSVDPESEASLLCKADGNPKPGIIWMRLGSTRVIHSESVFTFPAVTESDFGVYVCTATVRGFNEISREIYLMQNGPPRIISKDRQYAAVGDTAHVECIAKAVPKPDKIVWMKDDGQPIDYAASGRFSVTDEDLAYGSKSTLQILNIRSGDFGSYNCSVINSYGKDMFMVTLIEKDGFPLTYVVGGAVGGIAVLFVIILACVLYHRNKSHELESSVDTDSTTDKKKDFKSESPIDFKSTLMDQWRHDYNKDLYRYSADYDEVNMKYPPKDMHVNNNGVYTYGPDILANDPYGMNLDNGYVIGDDYGQRTDETDSTGRYESSYSTGYVPKSFRNDYADPYRLPPADLSNSKLATNV